MEIYNEEVRDLLGKELYKNLEVKERADIGVYVKDLSGYVVQNADDLDNIMKLGNKNRVVGATKMNVESSRSHAIFSITVESSEKDLKGDEHVKMGKLQLVDLAVSKKPSARCVQFFFKQLQIFLHRDLNDKVKHKRLAFDLRRRQKSIYLYRCWVMLLVR